MIVFCSIWQSLFLSPFVGANNTLLLLLLHDVSIQWLDHAFPPMSTVQSSSWTVPVHSTQACSVVSAQATAFSMQVFEGLWGTNELLSSFDSVNILKPGQHESSTDGWLHVDQAPLRKGVACIQGLVNMVDVSPETG